MKKEQVSEILTLDLSPKEAEILWNTIKANGYEENLEGLKTFVLACCGMGEKPTSQYEGVKFSQESVKATVDFLQNNPELVDGVKNMVLNGLKSKIFGRK